MPFIALKHSTGNETSNQEHYCGLAIYWTALFQKLVLFRLYEMRPTVSVPEVELLMKDMRECVCVVFRVTCGHKSN